MSWKGWGSNIIYLCNGHVTRDKKNTRVHGIMQNSVSNVVAGQYIHCHRVAEFSVCQNTATRLPQSRPQAM